MWTIRGHNPRPLCYHLFYLGQSRKCLSSRIVLCRYSLRSWCTIHDILPFQVPQYFSVSPHESISLQSLFYFTGDITLFLWFLGTPTIVQKKKKKNLVLLPHGVFVVLFNTVNLVLYFMTVPNSNFSQLIRISLTVTTGTN